jgi:hypothetical protein
MLVLRAFLALLAGFLTMALMVAVGAALLFRRLPDTVGSPGHARVGYVSSSTWATYACELWASKQTKKTRPRKAKAGQHNKMDIYLAQAS